MPRMTRLGALKIADPKIWRTTIVKAMKDAGGRIPDAATALGVSTRQLFRWLTLEEFSDVPRVANGTPRDGHRGRKKKEAPKVIPSRTRKAG